MLRTELAPLLSVVFVAATWSCTPPPELTGALASVADSVFPEKLDWSCPARLRGLIGCRAERRDTIYYFYADSQGVAYQLGIRTVTDDLTAMRRRAISFRIQYGESDNCSHDDGFFRTEDLRWRLEEYDLLLLASQPALGMRMAPYAATIWRLGRTGCSRPLDVPMFHPLP